MEAVYGRFEISDSLSLAVGGVSVYIRRVGDSLCEYSRGDGSVAKLFSCKRFVWVKPLAPVHLPINVASHLLIKFTKPVSVAPKSSIDVYALVPVEIGLYAWSSTGLLDILSPIPPKYSLYGKPETGVIARYCRSELFVSKPEASAYNAIVTLSLRNSTNHWIAVTRTVIPMARFRFFFAGNHVESPPVTMNVYSPSMATVTVNGSYRPENMEAGPPPAALAPGLLAGLSFTMEWGV